MTTNVESANNLIVKLAVETVAEEKVDSLGVAKGRIDEIVGIERVLYLCCLTCENNHNTSPQNWVILMF